MQGGGWTAAAAAVAAVAAAAAPANAEARHSNGIELSLNMILVQCKVKEINVLNQAAIVHQNLNLHVSILVFSGHSRSL